MITVTDFCRAQQLNCPMYSVTVTCTWLWLLPKLCVVQFVSQRVLKLQNSGFRATSSWKKCCGTLKGITDFCRSQHFNGPMYRYSRPWLLHILVPVCDVTHLHVWLNSFMCATCLIHICDGTSSCAVTYCQWLTHLFDSYVWLNSFMCVTQTCDVTRTHSYGWLICVT